MVSRNYKKTSRCLRVLWNQKSSMRWRYLASERVPLRSVIVKNTPVVLNVIVLLGRLPLLVKGLKDRDIDAPLEHRADGLLPVLSSLLRTRLGIIKVCAANRPTSLTNPELKVPLALNGLNAPQSLYNYC